MYGGFAGAAGPGAPSIGQEFEDFPRFLPTGRRPAVDGRVCGSIAEWRGKFGFITPDEPISHPEAHMKGGRIYLNQDDVMEMISGVGAHVSFYVYSDGNGLGALQCVPSESETAKKKLLKAGSKATPKPKAKAAATPGRKRVSETPLSGKVKSWRGGFGFITPSEPVDHPLFTGSLFLHSNDILSEGKNPDVGKSCSFFLYADAQGLGAEECTFEGDEDKASPGLPPSSPVSAPPSGMLNAKPKAAAVSSDGMMLPTAKAKAGPGGVMKATPKAAAIVKTAGDPDLAKKMADNPDLAKQLSAWMFDPGG